VYVMLQYRRVATAELRRLRRQQPAVVEQQTLPPARPLRHVRHRTRPLDGVRGRRGHVLVEKRREFGAKLLDVAIKSQLHGIPPRSLPGARQRRRASTRRPWLASTQTARRSPT